MSRIIGFQRDILPSKYLGVPLTDKPLHKIIWEPIINKMQDKIRKWKIKSLNLAGRLVLTKVVLQSIPIFMLSALPAPKGVLQQMRTIQRDFILGKGEERKKLALVAWDKLCIPKSHGGLGLDDPNVLSKVLGAKLWWHWVKEPKAQWAHVWKEKYSSTWQENYHIRMTRTIKGSHIWNKAWENRDLVQKNSFWEIREGDLALFWEDRWQQEPTLLREEFLDLKKETDTKGLLRVKYFWDQPSLEDKWRTWKNTELGMTTP